MSVVLFVQEVKRMRSIIKSPVACLWLPYFFHITS
jgi:hypothetical protein